MHLGLCQNGSTALINAAKFGHLAVLEFLCARGADVHLPEIVCDHVDVLIHSSIVRSHYQDGCTALDSVCRYLNGHHQTGSAMEMIATLLKYGADLYAAARV